MTNQRLVFACKSGLFHRFLAFVAACAAGLPATACYSYKPSVAEIVKPNEEIRVIVTEATGLRINQQFGLPTPLEGWLSPISADTYGVAVWVGQAYVGSEFGKVRQTIPLARNEILQIQRKELSVKRTTYCTLGVVAIVAVVVDRLGLVDLPWRDDTDTPLPPEPDPFRRRVRR